MAARIQRWLLLGAVCVAIGFATIFVWNDRPWWGASAAAVILSFYPAVLAVELGLASVVARRSAHRSPIPLPSLGQLIRAWAGECRAGISAFCWEQPFRSRAEPDLPVVGANSRRGVVLIHGLFCNRGFWNPWMRRFRALGNIPFTAVNLEPLFGSIDSYIGILEAAVVRMTEVGGKAPVVVAHSMGGLVVRRWLNEQRVSGRIHHVITIGTPHAGTWLARFSRTRNGREMSVDSAWLQALRRGARSADGAAELFTCFYGNCDNVVFPPENATLPDAENRLLGATAHVQLAFRPEVVSEVMRWLDDDAPPPRAHAAPFGVERPHHPATGGVS